MFLLAVAHLATRLYKFIANTLPLSLSIIKSQTWAADNNVKLNQDKTKEIVIIASRKRAPPPPRPDVERVFRLRVLSRCHLERQTADHLTMLLSSSSSLMYGTPTASLYDIFHATTIVSRIAYSTPTRRQRGRNVFGCQRRCK